MKANILLKWIIPFLITLFLVSCDEESVVQSEVLKPLVITSFTPDTARYGETIVITGENFSIIKDSNKVWIDNRFINVDSISTNNSSNNLYITVPDSIKSDKIRISNGKNEVATSQILTIIPEKKLKIFSYSTEADSVGKQIIIYGQMFAETGAMPTVEFNGAKATVDSVNTKSYPEKIYVTIPPTATTGKLLIKSGNQSVLSVIEFRVLPSTIPRIISTHVLANGSVSTLAIYIVKYVPKQKPEVQIGNLFCEVFEYGTDYILCILPEAVTSDIIKITDKNNLNIADQVIIKPVIASVEPTIVRVGQEVTINGKWYGNQKGNVKVEFDNDNAEVVSVKPDKITVKVPNGAQKRLITVHVNKVESNTKNTVITTIKDKDFYSAKFSLTSLSGQYQDYESPEVHRKGGTSIIPHMTNLDFLSCVNQIFSHNVDNTYSDSCQFLAYYQYGPDPIIDRVKTFDEMKIFSFKVSDDNMKFTNFTIAYSYYYYDPNSNNKVTRYFTITLKDIPVELTSNGFLTVYIAGTDIQKYVTNIKYETSSYTHGHTGGTVSSKLLTPDYLPTTILKIELK